MAAHGHGCVSDAQWLECSTSVPGHPLRNGLQFVVIQSFRSRTLRKLYKDDDASGVPAEHARKLRQILSLLDVAVAAGEMRIRPGFRVDALRADLAGYWSVTVSGDWRVSWRFEGGDVFDVDYLDYH